MVSEPQRRGCRGAPSSIFMYEIIPLSVSQVNWPAFNSMCQEVLGVDPLRSLDNEGIDPKDPAAFIAGLGFGESPRQFMRDAKDTNALNHVFMSFAAKLPNFLIFILSSKTNLKLLVKQGRQDHLVVLSGTGADWYEAIRVGCSESVDIEFRRLMTKVFNSFQNTCYREVFSNLNRKSLDDGTIVLRG